MKEWRFYGREEELQGVYNKMYSDIFIALAVFGGRGYGKTKLLEEAAAKLPGDYTTVYMELPDATEKYTNRPIYEEKVQEFYDEFRPRFEKTRFGYMLEELRIPENGDGFFEKGFGRILAHVVKQPKTVFIIDEAQNADDIGLIYPLKQTIDTLQRASGQKAGTLVLAGSHQQKMHKMMAADRPLGYRCQHLHLPPFNSQDLLRIGAEHGWLDRPRRFLTMYSALGGVPRLWEDFHEECSSGKFKDPILTDNDYTNDEKWQESFMQWRIDQLRQKPETQYLNPQNVDLPKYGEEILDELVNTFPSISFGNLRKKLVDKQIKSDEILDKIDQMKISYFDQGIYNNYKAAKEAAKKTVEISLHKEMNKPLTDMIYTLNKKLRIISIYNQPGVKDLPRRYGYQKYNDAKFIYISQPNVVFENVTKELWDIDESFDSGQKSKFVGSDKLDLTKKQIFQDVGDREGQALEKLVTDWFRTSTGIKYDVISGIRGFDHGIDDVKLTSKSQQSGPEIDLVIIWEPPNEVPGEIRVCECKRSINENSIEDLVNKIRKYAIMFEETYINQDEGPYNLKVALITPHGDNFELIKNQIKQMDADNPNQLDVEFWDLKDLADLMKISISPFPESTGKELENKNEGPNPSLDNYNPAPSPYDDDGPSP